MKCLCGDDPDIGKGISLLKKVLTTPMKRDDILRAPKFVDTIKNCRMFKNNSRIRQMATEICRIFLICFPPDLIGDSCWDRYKRESDHCRNSARVPIVPMEPMTIDENEVSADADIIVEIGYNNNDNNKCSPPNDLEKDNQRNASDTLVRVTEDYMEAEDYTTARTTDDYCDKLMGFHIISTSNVYYTELGPSERNTTIEHHYVQDCVTSGSAKVGLSTNPNVPIPCYGKARTNHKCNKPSPATNQTEKCLDAIKQFSIDHFVPTEMFLCIVCRQVYSLDIVDYHFFDERNIPRHKGHRRFRELIEKVKHIPYLSNHRKFWNHWKDMFISIRGQLHESENDLGNAIYCLGVTPDAFSGCGFSVTIYTYPADTLQINIDEAVLHFKEQYDVDCHFENRIDRTQDIHPVIQKYAHQPCFTLDYDEFEMKLEENNLEVLELDSQEELTGI